MNKRVFLLVFLAFFGFLALTQFALAQTLADNADKIENFVDKANDLGDTLSDKDSRNAYLKQEWNNQLQKTSFGRFLLVIGAWIGNLDPLFSIILGMPFSFSWSFLITFSLWILLAVLFFRILTFLDSFFINAKHAKAIKLSVFLVWIVIISTFRISKVITEGIFSSIPADSELTYHFLAALALLAIWIVIILSGKLARIFRSMKTSRKIEQNTKEIKKTKKEVERFEGETAKKERSERGLKSFEEEQIRDKELKRQAGRELGFDDDEF